MDKEMTMKRFVTTAPAVQGTGNPRMRISTPTPDRDGDRLYPEGCAIDNYKKNPVVLFGHDYKSLPVGGDAVVTIMPGKGIEASWRWLENDEFAGRVKNAYEQGFLSSSVGFKPKESRPNEHGGHDIMRWELLEFSLVPVPANPECTRMLKSLGLLGDDIGLERIPFIGRRESAHALVLDDEHRLIDWPLPVIDGIVRRTVKQALQQTVTTAIRNSINHARGRVD